MIIADLIFSSFSNQLLTILCTSKGHPTSFHATQILFCVLNDIFLAIPRSSFIIIDFYYYNFTASALPFHSSSLFLSLSLVLSKMLSAISTLQHSSYDHSPPPSRLMLCLRGNVTAKCCMLFPSFSIRHSTRKDRAGTTSRTGPTIRNHVPNILERPLILI